MSKAKKSGIKIGHYRITPLGIGAIAALVVIIAVAVVLLTTNGGADLQNKVVATNTAIPTATATAEVAATATPKPTATLPAITATPQPTATPEPAPRKATVRVLGEIMMEMDLLKSAANMTDETFDFSPMFSEIADYVGNADYTIADVEGTLGDTKGFAAEKSKYLTPSALLTTLSDIGVDMLMLANDHALDGGFEELKATMSNVKAAGMDYVGTASSPDEKASPLVKDINGIKVGFTAYCEKLKVSDIEEEAKTYGINLIDGSNAYTDVQALRDAGAEIVVAMVSWGDVFSHEPNEMQGKIAQVLVDAGADVIIGYNPHAIQPAMWLEVTGKDGVTKRALCICAPGNFLSNQREVGIDCGAIFEFTLAEQADGSIAVESPKYIPTYVLRYKNDDGLYQYRTVAINEYTGEAAALPEGMTAETVEYMKKILTAMEKILGTEVVTVAAE